MWQTQPDHGWSEWEDLGPEISGNPAVFQNADGHLEVFAAGPGGVMGHVWQLEPNGVTGWSEWEELGPEISGSPALFLNTDGNLEVFATGPSGALGHRWQTQPDHGWSEWEDLGPTISSDPVVFRNADSRLEVLGSGPGGVLGHMWQELPDRDWSGWDELGRDHRPTPPSSRTPTAASSCSRSARRASWDIAGSARPAAGKGWADWEDLGPAISARRPAVGQTGAIGGCSDTDRKSGPPVLTGPAAELAADFCVIGAGPTGVTVADGLIRAGASVVLVESWRT